MANRVYGEVRASDQERLRLSRWPSRDMLQGFTNEPLIPAPLSKNAALNLVQAIDRVFPPPEESWPADMDGEIGYLVINVGERLRELENILAAELVQIETFVTAQKGIYDTKRLVEDAEHIFSDAVRSWLSDQAVVDIRASGRCLAFELPTAAGFHLNRAVEDTIRKYYEILVLDLRAQIYFAHERPFFISYGSLAATTEEGGKES